MLQELNIKNHLSIVTVTLNPVIDKTLWISDFRPGKTFLAEKSDNFAGGKGVNVSRVLLHFNVHSTATGILGKTGKDIYLTIMEREGLSHDFFITDGNIRTNITVVSNSGKNETHLREKGPHIVPEILHQFKEKLQNLIAHFSSNRENHEGNPGSGKNPQQALNLKAPIIVFSGSLPVGLPQGTYFDLIIATKRFGATVFLDASAEPLREGIKAKPFFIKPNEHEVRQVLGFSPRSRADFLKAIKLFHEMGIERVMISRGKRGLLLSHGNAPLSAAVHVSSPINTVGSGDASVAGAVLGIINKFTARETARLSCALGAANTLIAGAGKLNREDVQKLYDSVTVELM